MGVVRARISDARVKSRVTQAPSAWCESRSPTAKSRSRRAPGTPRSPTVELKSSKATFFKNTQMMSLGVTVAYWHSWGGRPVVEVAILDGVPPTATFADVHKRALQEGAMRAATRRAPLVTGITPLGEAVAYHLVVDAAPVGAAVEADGFGALRPAKRIDLFLTTRLPDEPAFDAFGAPEDQMTAHLCALRARMFSNFGKH